MFEQATSHFAESPSDVAIAFSRTGMFEQERTPSRGLALIFVAALFCMPPSAMSEHGWFSRLGLGLMLAAMTLLLFRRAVRARSRQARPSAFLIGVGLLQIWIWIQLIVVGSPSEIPIIYAALATLATCMISLRVTADLPLTALTGRYVIILMSIAGFSGAITWGLLLAGVSPAQITVATIKIYKSWSGAPQNEILFPLTVTAGNLQWFGDLLPRSAGWFREPGIAQLFYVLAILLSRKLRMGRIWMTGLLLGVITSGSSVAVVSLLTAIAIVLLGSGSRPRTALRDMGRALSAAGLLGAAVVALFFLPSIGVTEKATQSGSVDERRTAAIAGLRLAAHHIGGVGLGNGGSGTSGINILALCGQLGLLGTLLLIFTYLTLGFGRSSDAYARAASIVVLITGLAAQPLVNMPTLYAMLLLVAGLPAAKDWRLGRDDAVPTIDPKRLSQVVTADLRKPGR